MKKLVPLFIAVCAFFNCGGGDTGPAKDAPSSAGAKVNFTKPDPLSVPESKTPKNDSDWEALVNNKEIEVIQVLNIINPIAVFITAGFEQYGARINNQTVHEEWEDTQAQLGQALSLYDSCKDRKKSGQFNKKLFLDMENTWQILVKTGVAGVRTKQMLDAELVKL